MSGFTEEFDGRVVGQNVDATTPDSVTAVQQLGFKNHGLVVRDESGATLWKQPDHDVVVEDARAAIKELLDRG